MPYAPLDGLTAYAFHPDSRFHRARRSSHDQPRGSTLTANDCATAALPDRAPVSRKVPAIDLTIAANDRAIAEATLAVICVTITERFRSPHGTRPLTEPP